MKALRMPGVVALGLLTGAMALGAPEVGAITKDQCVDANTKAQSLRRDGKFAAAREQLTLCIDRSCPGIVRDDCTQRLDELERAQPTVVFDAKSAVGEDVVLVHVAVDGVRLADVLDGRALGVDPGQHVFTFEVPGQAPTTYRFVLKEGEKDRRERIVLAGAPEPAASVTAPKAPEPPRGQTQRVAGLVLGAAGLAGIGVGAVFGLLTIHDWSSSKSECSTTSCTNANYQAAVSDHDRAETSSTIATAGFIAGGVLLATGVVAWLTSPSTGAESAPTASVRLAPALGPGLAGFAVTGRF